jgi:alpha-beta hydrolase superfamily lysophospholipase
MLPRLYPFFVRFGTVTMICACAAVLGACSGSPDTVDPEVPAIKCGRLSVANSAGTSCTPLATTGVSEKAVEFPSKGTAGGLITLRGTITTPRFAPDVDPPSRLPAALLIHGSGPQSQDGVLPADLKGPFAAPVPTLKDLAQALSKRGFVVLRFDKRTCTAQAQPDCTYPLEIASRAGWDDLIGDVEAAASFLGSQPSVDTGDIVLVGHSQGATLALLTGPRIKPSAYVLLSGLYEPVDKALVRQVRWQIEQNADKLSPKERKAADNKLAEIESSMLAIREGYWPEEEKLLGAPGKFWKRWMEDGEKAQGLLASAKAPVLYLRGDDDENATDADLQGYKSALAGKRGSSAAALPGLSHGLHERSGPGKVSSKATDAILSWLTR